MSTLHRYPRSNIVQSRSFLAGGVVLILIGAFILTPPGTELYAYLGGYLGRALEGMEHAAVMAGVFVICGVICAAIGGFQYLPRSRVYETDDTGIRRQGSKNARLQWSEIEQISLLEIAYIYSVDKYSSPFRRNKLVTPDAEHSYHSEGYPFISGGAYWLRLKINGKGAKFMLESPLSGFKDILARAAQLTAGGRVQADDNTRRNFETLGYPLK